MDLGRIFGIDYPIIAPLVLKPLPGAPGYGGDINGVIDSAMKEARLLEDAGVDGLLFENLGDVPYFKTQPLPETIASFGRVIGEVRREISLPFGVNVLRNCGEASLALAFSHGGRWIRVNVLTEAYVTDQGIIEGIATELTRMRSRLGAGHIAVFADVHVKHALPLARRPIRESALDAVERGLADAIVITGPRTGSPPAPDDLREVKGVADVLIGSGLNHDNVKRLLPLAKGAIVSSSFRRNGTVTNELEARRVKSFMNLVKGLRRS